MDDQVSIGVWRPKDVSLFPAIIKLVQAWGRIVPVPSRLSSYCQHGFNQRKEWGAEPRVLHQPKRDKVKCMIRLDFPKTNNEAKYEALAKAAGAANMFVYCDSQVVTSQVNGDYDCNYDCKNKQMRRYLGQVKNQVGSLQA